MKKRDRRSTIGTDSLGLSKYAAPKAQFHYQQASESVIRLLKALWPDAFVLRHDDDGDSAVIVMGDVRGTQAHTWVVEFKVPIRKTVKVGARWQWAHIDVVAAVAVVKKITAEFPVPQFSLEYEGLKCAAGFVRQFNQYLFG